MEIELKKTLRPVDLALKAGRKRQSARTRFVHVANALDLISIYENFCFAVALLEQRKGDDVSEAKELLLKLLAFQTEEGNFPLHLHEYPTCYDSLQRLKVAPLLLRALEDFGAVLGADARDKISAALTRALAFDKELPPLWQFRKDVCLGKRPEKPLAISDWWEYWISLQFLETPVTSLFHDGLKIYGGSEEIAQEGFDPAPQLLEWMLFPGRPDHPSMIQLAALKELHQAPFDPGVDAISEEHLLLLKTPNGAKLLWQGDARVHSLVVPGSAALHSRGVTVDNTLESPCPISRSDLFETNLFFDADPELDISIDGIKGTVFKLGDELIVRSSRLTVRIRCEIAQGTGNFCGHIFRGNRPGQTLNQNYEAFDWRVGIRTIHRSDDCILRWMVDFQPL